MGVWIWVVIGLALLAGIGLGVLTSRGMRAGRTPPGPPTDLETNSHDEPDTDIGRLLDEKRHVHSSEDVSKAARDADRMLGH